MAIVCAGSAAIDPWLQAIEFKKENTIARGAGKTEAAEGTRKRNISDDRGSTRR